MNGHKFHLRVYVLCVGALRVFVFEKILILIAAHKYDLNDTDNIFSNLTNTARSAEDVHFDEKINVRDKFSECVQFADQAIGIAQ